MVGWNGEMMRDSGVNLLELAVIPRPPLEESRPIKFRIKEKEKLKFAATLRFQSPGIFEMGTSPETERRIFYKRACVKRLVCYL